MKPINTNKEVHIGGKWELRVRLTDDTKLLFNQLKETLQTKRGKTYSDSRFFEVLMHEVATILKLTP